MKKGIKKIIGLIIAGLFIWTAYSPTVRGVTDIPAKINLFRGEDRGYMLPLSSLFQVESSQEDIIEIADGSYEAGQGGEVYLRPIQQGVARLKVKLFGLLPIKNVEVSVNKPRELVPCGHTIGVSLKTKGALVVGISEILDNAGSHRCPAIDAGLMPGDVIERINGENVKDAEHLLQVVADARGRSIAIEYNRKGAQHVTVIYPLKDSYDGQYRLGLWVRDSTAGVGTLTFVDLDTGVFGALGHPITDIDTGILLEAEKGRIQYSRVVDVVQGQKGHPGELKGAFITSGAGIGQIQANTEYGLFGTVDKSVMGTFKGIGAIEVAHPYEVHEGPASILTTVGDEGVKEYNVSIIHIYQQHHPSAKGMVVRVTDPALIARTGGIVQGMSGSPILQDGRLVGAVTHVFVNDPLKGYGVFLEWMLDEVDELK